MKHRILRYFLHITITLIVLILIGVVVLLSENGAVHYGDNYEKYNLDMDGPYAFYTKDSLLNVYYIKGNKTIGYSTQYQIYNSNKPDSLFSFFRLDSSLFHFTLTTEINTPPVEYNDGENIIAISDVEGGFLAFKNLLQHHKVIDSNLNWIYEKGHLVLVGDFIDRGYSSTQVLWFIYHLEQQAKKVGGNVHFILGNHELKNLHGDYYSAADKYHLVSAILEKQQFELYNNQSFIGRWLSSKNTIEKINGYLFVHGGLPPEITRFNLSLLELNQIIRANYRSIHYPKNTGSIDQFLTSTKTGPAWYRGYFKNDTISTNNVEQTLNYFQAKAVIVGHTLQNKITTKFDGRVIGIDVRHPKDYHKNWPKKNAEALLIKKNQTMFRLIQNGKKILLN